MRLKEGSAVRDCKNQLSETIVRLRHNRLSSTRIRRVANHCGARGCGLSAFCSSPTAGQAADYWVLGREHAFNLERLRRRISPTSARARLD